MDEATLSVIWRDHVLRMGYTKQFRLLAHLVRRVNRYVTHVDLLEDLWDDDFADVSLLRAGIPRLKTKLRREECPTWPTRSSGAKGATSSTWPPPRVTEESS